MSATMVRKQLYLAREQDRKLKALAARRGCTEAQVIRDALDQLPDPALGIEDQLAAAGLLAPRSEDAGAPVGHPARALEAEVDAWLAARPAGLGLSEAVLEDRSGR
jgi:hypothetical protein